jgi:ankyrin repeat protein
VACWNNQLEAVNKLIEHKANLNQSDHRGWTPLIISVYQNNEDIVASLLEAACDIEKKDCVLFI